MEGSAELVASWMSCPYRSESYAWMWPILQPLLVSGRFLAHLGLHKILELCLARHHGHARATEGHGGRGSQYGAACLDWMDITPDADESTTNTSARSLDVRSY